jgi:hypothetical protein
MKSENQNVVAGKSSRQHLMFVHISARSNLIAESLTNANLVSSSYLWTNGPPIVVGEPYESIHDQMIKTCFATCFRMVAGRD